MALRAEVGGIRIEADSAEELAELIRLYSANASGSSVSDSGFSRGEVTRKRVSGTQRRGPSGRQTSEAVFPQKSREDAMTRVFDSVRDARYRRAMRALAAAGERGMNDDQLREVAGLKGRISGFTGTIVRRAKLYGLRTEDVLRKKTVHAMGRRMYHYQFTPGMIAVIGPTREEAGETP